MNESHSRPHGQALCSEVEYTGGHLTQRAREGGALASVSSLCRGLTRKAKGGAVSGDTLYECEIAER